MGTASDSDMERRAPLPFSLDSPQSCKTAWNTCIFSPSSLAYLFRCFGQFLQSDHCMEYPGQHFLSIKYSTQLSTHYPFIKVQCPDQHSLPVHQSVVPRLVLPVHQSAVPGSELTACPSKCSQYVAHFLEEITPVFHRRQSA